MWYKNIAGRFFGLVTKHACDRRTDRQTDRITTPNTALAQLRRAVKTECELCRWRDTQLRIPTLFCYLVPAEETFIAKGTIRLKGPSRCTVVQAVVKANSQSNGNGHISTSEAPKPLNRDAFRTFISTRISQLLTQECVSHFGSYEQLREIVAKNCFAMTD